MVKQNRLEWRQELYGLVPYWTMEPNSDVIESIVRSNLIIDPDGRCQVHFYAQEAFNKLYKVDTDKGIFLMCNYRVCPRGNRDSGTWHNCIRGSSDNDLDFE